MNIEYKHQANGSPFPAMPAIQGVDIGAVPAGLRYQGRHDLMMARFDEGTTSAAVFTSNLIAAAPVKWSRALMPEGYSDRIRGLVVNAGNANAMTGGRGDRTARSTAECAAENSGVTAEQILLASTGVIGEIMAPGPLRRGISRLAGGLSASLYQDAAKAIMTTDTVEKGATRMAEIDGVPVMINGIAKGSGMIAPDMATMLGFLFTDASISGEALYGCLRRVVERSFNAISVDGDTSTNDTVAAFATGQAANGDVPHITSADDPRLTDFMDKLSDVATTLAKMIVRDGEGASKFVTLQIEGADTDADAMKIAKTIAGSPLVKTAFAGEDPNWGPNGSRRGSIRSAV